MIRAFAAITLPDGVVGELTLLQHMLPLPRQVAPENLHLTLVFLGSLHEDTLEDVHLAFSRLRAPPFDLTLRGVEAFGGARPRNVWAGVAPSAGLTHLQRKVETAARGAGVAIEARRFTPHVTLGRFRPDEADMPRLERGMVDCAGFSAGPFAVTRFALMRSHLGRAGAEYDVLESYALDADD